VEPVFGAFSRAVVFLPVFTRLRLVPDSVLLGLLFLVRVFGKRTGFLSLRFWIAVRINGIDPL